MRTILTTLALAACLTTAVAGEAGFTPIFDGTTLNGWHVSAKTGHSRTSKHASAGRWVVEDGAITGSQDIPGNGGIILTDRLYGDCEVALEMRNDYGPDSGLFLRCTEDGKCYQAMIDYHGGGSLMGIYGEGLGGKPHLRSFTFGKTPDVITLHTEFGKAPVPVPLAMTAAEWATFWRHGEWQELRARIVGDPPTVTTWIKGVKIMEFTETVKRLGAKGSIGLQVHGGGDFTRQFVRYRNIRIKELAP